ncbi:replication initiation protein, partial [Acinetobacter pittii]
IIRQKKTAIKMPYIQHNPPSFISSLVFDVDTSDAYFSWFDANLPTPSWISKNRQNNHAHIGYMLATPVCTTHNAKHKIIEYTAKIQQAYSLALGADQGYSGLITKNPCNSQWENHIFDVQPYDLGYLADFVELQELKTDLKEVSGLGRNCMMFDTVRFWAYEAIRVFISGAPDDWYAEVLKVAINANDAFIQPLPYSEVKATAKSIARWVWRSHTEAHAKFIERQSIKGKTGAIMANSKGACIAGGRARSQQYSDMRQEAMKFHILGFSKTEIAIKLNVSRRTVIRWLNNEVKKVI